MQHRSTRFLHRSLSLLALALVAACASVPQTGTPQVPLAASGIASHESLAAGTNAAWPGEDWWRGYADPQLEALVAEGLANSPDVAAAQARLRRADGMAQAAGAALLPSLDLKGSASGEKLSYNTGLPKAFLPQGWNDYGQIAGALEWDIDLWGRNRAGLAAARSERRAAQIDALQARLVLASTIARAYADLARQFEEVDIRTGALEMRRSGEALVAQRVAGGMDTRGNLRLVEAQTAAARSELSAAQEGLLLRRHQIAALVGAGPDRGLAITRPQWTTIEPQDLPDGVTTALVARRPDIAMARERVEAAAARVKVARADFYPAIRLSALYGLQSLELDMLFKHDSSRGRVGGIVSLPIFHGGEISGHYRGARATFDEAVADYNHTVLDAYRQVADAATGRRMLAERLGDVRAALAASEEAHAIARRRYEGGLSTYLDVLAVEDRLLQARMAASTLEAASRSADIALIRALGGGFADPGAQPKDATHE